MNTTKGDTMNKLEAAGIAKIREAATKLGTQDVNLVKQTLCPRMSQGHWNRLLRSAGIG
jgi:hypothetical protein